MGAVVLTAVGLLLLQEHLSGKAAHAWAMIGAYLYLFGAVLIVTAEALALSGVRATHVLVVMYVVLALVGQAAVGIAIARTDALPRAIGWLTLAWNVAWLIMLPLATPSEIYFPVVHHAMPLVIGSALLLARGDSKTW